MKKLWNVKYLGRILCMLFIITAMLVGCQGNVEDLDSYLSNHIKSNNTNTDETDIQDTEDIGTEDIDIENIESDKVIEDEMYTTKDEVAEYIYKFGHLPSNFIRKSEAKKLGWENSQGNLGEVAPGMSIGGDRFGNYEGLLPEEDGRKYYECDINFDGGYRGAERIVYSNDGLIYYTGDHYETFELLYGEE